MTEINTDITNLSYRMTKQLDLAMNDLKNVKRNIKQMNTIIKKETRYNSERNIENNYGEKYEDYGEKIEEKIEEEMNIPAAGFAGTQHNMSHNRWMSSLRNPFSYYY
jgi:hypothetical protein